MWSTSGGGSKKEVLLKELSSILSSQSSVNFPSPGSVGVAQTRGEVTSPRGRGVHSHGTSLSTVPQANSTTLSLVKKVGPTHTTARKNGDVCEVKKEEAFDLEKRALDQLERSVQEEEFEAQMSRERMSLVRDQVKVSGVFLGHRTYAFGLDYILPGCYAVSREECNILECGNLQALAQCVERTHRRT